MLDSKKYDIALSFAGEEREYVVKVAEFLQSKGVRVFDDDFEAVSLWGTDLMEKFDEIYRKISRYAVLFISKQYKEKMWTRHERRAALARALEQDREYILPARFDDTEIVGLLPTTRYIDLRSLSPAGFGVMICQKIGHDISSSKLNQVPYPHSPDSSGEATFDYSNNDGRYRIGREPYLFETYWSKSSDWNIQFINDPPTIRGVALAPRHAILSDIKDASQLDYSSRIRRPNLGQFVVLQNSNGFYAVLEILDIKDDSRNDDRDELTFRYWILTDGSMDFSKIAP